MIAENKSDQSPGYSGRGWICVADIEFVSTPTDIVRDAARELEKRELDAVPQADPSLVALSQIGHMPVGKA